MLVPFLLICLRFFSPEYVAEAQGCQSGRMELGLQTRGWSEKTVWHAGPCLFGLSTVVTILFDPLPESKRTRAVEWHGKTVTTFSGASVAVG
jgi:hypothetical protein